MRTIKWKIRLILRYLIISYRSKREFKSELISYLLSLALEFVAIVLFWFSLKNSGVAFEGWQSEDIIALNAFFLVS